MAENTPAYKKAFPISASDNLSDKILNEENITGIVKNICGNDKFIIGISDEGYIKFILDGYYFEIEKPTEKTFVSIDYKVPTKGSYIGKIFNNLVFSNTSGDLQLTDAGGNIIEQNKVIFTSDQFPNTISCGHVQ